jgi:ribosome-binding factor A
MCPSDERGMTTGCCILAFLAHFQIGSKIILLAPSPLIGLPGQYILYIRMDCLGVVRRPETSAIKPTQISVLCCRFAHLFESTSSSSSPSSISFYTEAIEIMKSSRLNSCYAIGGLAFLFLQLSSAFTNHQPSTARLQKLESSSLLYGMYNSGRASYRSGKERSKRQYRVSQLVQTELGKIIHTGIIKGDVDYLDDELRRRISIVSVDVAPDLRQARISTSVRGSNNPESNAAVDKRRAYSWLVQNTGPLRHSLAQKMSHLKSSPNLTFVQVDVAAAVGTFFLLLFASLCLYC